jgi:hypothetical protein
VVDWVSMRTPRVGRCGSSVHLERATETLRTAGDETKQKDLGFVLLVVTELFNGQLV